MGYFAGIDGGGSKTHCIIGDERGTVLAEGFAPGSNYQMAGQEAARQAIYDSLHSALKKLDIAIEQIEYAVLGLAGADMECDFKVLNHICCEIFKKVPFKVLNDTWIGLRAGVPENWGVVTVCGSGASCAGRNRSGYEVILRNLDYELGNRGGGIDIIKDALHFAFRSEEETAPKTRLTEEIPKLLEADGMSRLAEILRNRTFDMTKLHAIPVLVFKLAADGDSICQDILVNMGHVLGEIAGGVIKRLGMEKEMLTVTLVGSIFEGSSPLLIDEYTTTVHRTAPYAKVEVAGLKPAMGAYYLALEQHA
ncbi:MAG: hypothetical protein APF77_12085 [Clostridia bacterium BRH_c25]|nr:MAG: hypothetical protein APF77_12085 [Clostridia bacterium BRH_c25]